MTDVKALADGLSEAQVRLLDTAYYGCGGWKVVRANAGLQEKGLQVRGSAYLTGPWRDVLAELARRQKEAPDAE